MDVETLGSESGMARRLRWVSVAIVLSWILLLGWLVGWSIFWVLELAGQDPIDRRYALAQEIVTNRGKLQVFPLGRILAVP